MSNFDLSQEQRDAINNRTGFVEYRPYTTVIPAYNLNAIQCGILENQSGIENLKKEILNTENGFQIDLKQLSSELDFFFNTLKKAIEEPTFKIYTATLDANNWDLVNKKQELKILDILASDHPIVWLDLEELSTPTGDDAIDLSNAIKRVQVIEDWPLVSRIEAINGGIIAYCYEEIPSIDIPIMLRVDVEQKVSVSSFFPSLEDTPTPIEQEV